MKLGRAVHLAAGAMIGAAAVRWLDSLSARKLRRIKRFCVQSGRKMAEKADDLLG